MDKRLAYRLLRTNGICEMLVQSHLKAEDGTVLVHLLPALPSAWPHGQVYGLRVRGGATVGLVWQDGELTRCYLQGGTQPITVKYGEISKKVESADPIAVLDGELEAASLER